MRIKVWIAQVFPAVAALLILASSVVPAGVEDDSETSLTHSGYGEDVERGWYWYEVEKEEPEEGEEELASDKALQNADPWKMSAEEFRKYLDDRKDRAVASPTVENVSRYIEAQDVARRKAVAFANVFQLVMQTNPEFTTTAQYPSTTPGIKALTAMRSEEVEVVIRDRAGDYALIYFHRPDCKFCKAQNGILQFFIDKYSWPIKMVNLYDAPDAASRFNVTMVPHLLVVSRETGKYMPVSTGVISFTDLERRLYNSIRYMRGDITPSRYSLYEHQLGGAGDPERTDIGSIVRDVSGGISVGQGTGR